MSKQIAFVISSMTPGGAEKVMSVLANEAVNLGVKVHLIILSNKRRFYSTDERVNVYEPDFVIESMPRIWFVVRNFFWLRKTLSGIPVDHVLSFSGKFNSYVIMTSLGQGKKILISDRSRPGISYGKFLDLLNPFVYRLSKGIIAQTEKAKEFAWKQTKHSNIKVIPNPVNIPGAEPSENREKLIINVGRFIGSKHQDWLMDYFEDSGISGWRLSFLGDGKRLNEVKKKAQNSKNGLDISFEGNNKNISDWYNKASIFALTSTSEGFPNALAEAMAHGCACIAFDCVAGPSDLIDDGANGFLIPEADHKQYREKLILLMKEESLRRRFGKAAREKMKEFDSVKITRRYLDFIFGQTYK